MWKPLKSALKLEKNYNSHVLWRPLFPANHSSLLYVLFWRKSQACLGCFLTTWRTEVTFLRSDRRSAASYRPVRHTWSNFPRLRRPREMSAGGQTTRSRDIPAVRRIAIHDSAHMPQEYSTTPGGTMFSTTPGGNHAQKKIRQP